MKQPLSAGRPGNASDSTAERLRAAYGLLMQNRLAEAEKACRAVLFTAPNNPLALDLMGLILRVADNEAGAYPYFKRAIAADPRQPAARLHLTSLLMAWLRFAEAEGEARQALRLQPRSVEGICYLAICRLNLGHPDEAIRLFRSALALAPNDPTLLCEAASGFAAVDDFAEAGRLYRQALKHRASVAEATWRLVELGKDAGPSPPLADIEKLIAEGKLSPDEQVKLHQSAATLLAREKRYDEAFEHFRRARAVYAARYDAGKEQALSRAQRNLYTAEFFAARNGRGDPSARPIFIVGMPRSGTSMLEQMLGRHPQIAAGGELPDIGRITRPLFATDNWGTYAERVRGLSAEDVAGFAADYLSVTRQIAPQAERVTDKMPDNFKQVGLIALMFPNATIVHLRRDAMDNCVSCFTTMFVGARHAYAGTLKTLGEYYADYARLMEHWDAVLPGRMLDLRYEALVANPEEQLRRVLARAGLEWDPACLDFHESAREVQTASRFQVKQPLYSSSIGRWRVYEKHLGPLKAALGPLADPAAGPAAP